MLRFVRSLLVLSFCASLSACEFENVQKTGFLEYSPDPGYVWANPDSMFSMDVVWRSGQRFPGIDRISSSDKIGSWRPDDGFTWVDRNDMRKGVEWRSGIKSRVFPNIITGQSLDTWFPFPGYRFISESPTYPDNISVAWSPGSRWSAWPNVYAASEEGMWLPDSGYRFIDPSKSLAVEPVYSGIDSQPTQQEDSAGAHFGKAMLLEACPDANEDSWAITKILSEACDRAQAKEIERGFSHILND